MHVKMSSAKRRPSCLCLNVLTRAMEYDIEPHVRFLYSIYRGSKVSHIELTPT